ncbi:Mitochondrial 18 KDa protein (MTP18) [Teratosphaeria destructans]|uniref:Mitochondrial fission process protein 1 n=1 Tax=Teratosphaeria destructans TaxID=418781 RepID=A0A9W7SY38_9PEZI|nr:Mitochondrial 18 KDa protein (MTP18) [Teratosphaeria destructans]
MSNSKPNPPDTTIEHTRTDPRPDFSQPLPRKRLPASLQDTLDNDEKWWDAITEGKGPESTDTPVRYAAYANRLRTIMLAAHRYVAYTSDIGESFRPVAHPIAVRAAYGISWAYIGGDVAYEGYKPTNGTKLSCIRMPPPMSLLPRRAPGKVALIDHYGVVMAQRAAFQSIASMGLPAFTIHSVVRYSGRALKNARNATIRTWGPIGLGLAVVPALPYMFDKPIEEATEWVAHKVCEAVGGPEAVAHRSPEATLEVGTGKRKEGVVGKEKEL